MIIAHFKEEHLKTDHQNETETDDNKKTDNEAEPTPEESAEPDARHEVDDLTDPTPNIVPTIERQCEVNNTSTIFVSQSQYDFNQANHLSGLSRSARVRRSLHQTQAYGASHLHSMSNAIS